MNDNKTKQKKRRHTCRSKWNGQLALNATDSNDMP